MLLKQAKNVKYGLLLQCKQKYSGTSKNFKPIGLFCKEMVYHIC